MSEHHPGPDPDMIEAQAGSIDRAPEEAEDLARGLGATGLGPELAAKPEAGAGQADDAAAEHDEDQPAPPQLKFAGGVMSSLPRLMSGGSRMWTKSSPESRARLRSRSGTRFGELSARRLARQAPSESRPDTSEEQ